MNKLTLRQMSQQSIIAALYVALVLSMGGLAYGPIQFRYAEILNLLAFFNPIHGIGITLGVFISNFWSELGAVDLLFGTLHTAISVFFILKSKNIIIASLWPTIFAFIIGFELSIIAKFGDIYIMTIQVMLSEFIIMTLIAVPIFRFLSESKQFVNTIAKKERLKEINTLNSSNIYPYIFVIVSIIIFIFLVVFNIIKIA